MNYYKIVGTVLIVLGSIGLAFLLCSHQEKKYRRLCAYIDLLRYIKIQIDCYCATIEEILCRCDKEIIKNCGCMCIVLDFSSLLNNSDLCLDEKAVKLLYAFNGEIGKGYKDSQIAVCDYYIKELCDIKDEWEKKLPNLKKVCTTVCICVGIMIVIILL